MRIGMLRGPTKHRSRISTLAKRSIADIADRSENSAGSSPDHPVEPDAGFALALLEVRFGLVGRQATLETPTTPVCVESFPSFLQVWISQFALLGSGGEAAATSEHLPAGVCARSGAAFSQHHPHWLLRRLAPAAGAMCDLRVEIVRHGCLLTHAPGRQRVGSRSGFLLSARANESKYTVIFQTGFDPFVN